MGGQYFFDWTIVEDNWQEFLGAVWVDVWVTLAAFGLAVVAGLLVGLARHSRVRVLRVPAAVFIQVFGGVPTYMLLYWVYFGLATAVALPLTSIQAAIVALALNGTSYAAEAFRSGMRSVDAGHVEAARALGLSAARVQFDVVLPQALRFAVPPLANILVILLKGSTLISVIAVADVVFLARDIAILDFTPFEPYTMVAVVFALIVLVFSMLTTLLERRMKVPV